MSSDESILISLLLPTRGRPKLVKRFFESVSKYSNDIENIEIILYIDDDDIESHGINNPYLNVTTLIGPQLTMGEYNSRCLGASSGDVIILVNDDMVIKTNHWDEKIREVHRSYKDQIYLAYCNDCFKGRKLSTFPILSRKTCSILKEPYPRAYQGAFIDHHLFDVFKRLQHAGHNRIVYLNNIVFEHLHYRLGKAQYDETYSKRNRFEDDAVFLSLIEIRQQCVEQLIKSIQGDVYIEEPAYPSIRPKTLADTDILTVLSSLTKRLLMDHRLPLGWRSWLWFWFFGRYLAANGWLKPFIKNE